LYGTAPQVGTYVLLGVGEAGAEAEAGADAEVANDPGEVGDAGPDVGAGAVDVPAADGAVLDREALTFDDALEHPALRSSATPTASAGASQDRRTWACIGSWYGNCNSWQYCYG
jgi:hypothetical protein